MADLTINYLGMSLKNPIVASSSPLCRKLENLKVMEDSGVAAVVLHSLFEEQVNKEQLILDKGMTQGTEHFAEALSYLPDVGAYRFSSSEYLEYIQKAKNAVKIPVIGSLNGSSTGGWIRYAREMEQAGVDAIELNIYDLPVSPDISSSQIEQRYIDLVKNIIETVNIPVAVKIGPFFSSIPYITNKLSEAGARGVVIFNRFYQPDIDLNKMEIKSVLNLSTSQELLLRIRWAAILFRNVRIDLAITGGVHSALDVLKCIASGARVSMTTSLLLQKGISHVSFLVAQINEWMNENQYDSMESLLGVMSRGSVENPEAFERANYMKILGTYDQNSI